MILLCLSPSKHKKYKQKKGNKDKNANVIKTFRGNYTPSLEVWENDTLC